MADFFLIQNKIISVTDGATVTPVDDYTIWLRCAELPNTYGSLANVMADTTAMETICNNVNALRYMVRSNSVIMPSVMGSNDWVSELEGCAFAVTIPTLTSNTSSPLGTAIYSTYYNNDNNWNAWQAFNNTLNAFAWMSNVTTPLGQYVGFVFNTQTMILYRFGMTGRNSTPQCSPKTFKIQGTNDGSTWEDVTGNLIKTQNTETENPMEYFLTGSENHYKGFRAYMIDMYASQTVAVGELKLYGLDLS